MTISLLQYISDVKNEIQFWENEINFYLNEIKLLHIRLDNYLKRDINEYQENKLQKFQGINSKIKAEAQKLYSEIDTFDDSLLRNNNDNKLNDETFEKFNYFKERIDNLANDYMEYKDELIRFTISSLS